MALRNNPYLPLYVQDFLTDEKLAYCSAMANGVYIRLMCILHKSETYGKILLKQNFKQNPSTCLNFASMLLRQMPYDMNEIYDGLTELVENEVITIEGDFLYQKRMVHDGELSDKRAVAGKKGGIRTTSILLEQNSKQNSSKHSSKSEANTEVENENIDIDKKRVLGEKKEEEEWIEKMYALYPTKCPVQGRSLGKCRKDKERIQRLQKDYTREEIEMVIRAEVSPSNRHYLKNFSTFLNNFPDPSTITVQALPVAETPKNNSDDGGWQL